MSDIPNAAPEGAGEQPTAPTPPAGPMGMSAAAQVLAGLDDTPEEAAAATETDDSAQQDTIDQPSEEAATGDESEAAEPEETVPDEDAEPAEDAEPDAETTEEDQLAHGNMRTRLRDGTVTTVGELKKLADEAREYRAKAPQIAAQERQLSERMAQLAEREQFVQTQMPEILAILQTVVPPPPNPALADRNHPDSDIVRYMEDLAAHNAGLARLQQVQAANARLNAQQQQQADAKAAAELEARVAEGRKFLAEKIPGFGEDPKVNATVQKRILDYAAKYGISADEVARNENFKAFHMVYESSLIVEAYNKLMAQKKAVEKKVGTVPPVQRPGPRVSQEDATQRGLDDEFKKFRDNGGGMSGAAKVLALLE